MEYKGLMSTKKKKKRKKERKEKKQSINELVVISISTLDITLIPFAKLLPAEVQSRLIQGIRRGEGVGDYLHIHQRYKD